MLYSCKSVPSDLASYNPVAIITVYSNTSVPWYSESSGSETVDDGVLTGMVNRMIDKNNPETAKAQERIDEAACQDRLADVDVDLFLKAAFKNRVISLCNTTSFYT